jgi:uncharacterized membrane protein YfcA
MEMLIVIAGIGVLTGFLSGLLGIGGGILISPACVSAGIELSRLQQVWVFSAASSVRAAPSS